MGKNGTFYVKFYIQINSTFLCSFHGYISSSIAAKLRTSLTQLGDSTSELTKMSIESELTIREHCDSVRRQVDIARELAIESIHKESNALMTEIDAYERECCSGWQAVEESTKEAVVEDVSKRARAFLAKQQSLLQSLSASDVI